MNQTNQGDQDQESPKKKRGLFRNEYGNINPVTSGIAVAIGLSMLIMFSAFVKEFYTVIEPVHEGLVVKTGELQEGVLNNGFYWKTPWLTDINSVFTGTISTDDTAIEGEEGEFTEVSPYRGIKPLSKDGQELTMDVQLNYTVVDVRKFYTKTGSTIPQKIEQLYIIPKIRKYIKDIATEYGWKSLILEGERVEFSQRVSDAMTDGKLTQRVCEGSSTVIDEETGIETIVQAGCRLEDRDDASLKPEDFGVRIDSVNFKDIKPSGAIIAAIEKSLAKEQEVKIAIEEAEIAKAKAQEQIETKRGATEAQKLQAAADAYKIRVDYEEQAAGKKALAEAETALKKALAGSKELIDYKRLLEVDAVNAQANLEYAKHYQGNVPDTITIIGTDEAKDASLFYGMPGIVANPTR